MEKQAGLGNQVVGKEGAAVSARVAVQLSVLNKLVEYAEKLSDELSQSIFEETQQFFEHEDQEDCECKEGKKALVKEVREWLDANVSEIAGNVIVEASMWKWSDVKAVMRKYNVPVTEQNLDVFLTALTLRTLSERASLEKLDLLVTSLDCDFFYGKYKVQRGFLLYGLDGLPGDVVPFQDAQKHQHEKKGSYRTVYLVIDAETGMRPDAAEHYHLDVSDAIQEARDIAGLSKVNA